MAFTWRLEVAQERFMKKVRKDEATGCWIWQGWTTNGKYGGVFYRGRNIQAHRAAYLLFVGPIPKGKVIRHSCDNGLCVNYEKHLLIGTHQQNVDDKMDRGRYVRVPHHGTLNGRAKLTEDQVVQVLTAEPFFGYRKRLAKDLGVTEFLVGKIRCGKLWAHVRTDLPRFPYAQHPTGSAHPNSKKLTDEQVLEIFQSPRGKEARIALGQKFGISKSLIERIRYGQTRSELTTQNQN